MRPEQNLSRQLFAALQGALAERVRARWKGRPLVEALRLLRFGVVGILALGIYWLATNLLVWFGLALLAASVVGYVAAGLVSYFGHSYFSFRVVADHATYGTKFLVVALLGLLINVVLVQVCSAARIPASVMTALIGLCIPCFNYVFNRLWVFGSGLDSPTV